MGAFASRRCADKTKDSPIQKSFPPSFANKIQTNKSIQVGDEVFIYIGNPIKAIKYRCKVNKANTDIREIDDSEFILTGDAYEKYGNYMELELLEEFDDKKYSLDVLRANGLKGNIQCPRRANDCIK